MPNNIEPEFSSLLPGIFSFNGIKIIKETGQHLKISGPNLKKALKNLPLDTTVLDLSYIDFTTLLETFEGGYKREVKLQDGIIDAFKHLPPSVAVLNLYDPQLDQLSNINELILLLDSIPDSVKIVYRGRNDRYPHISPADQIKLQESLKHKGFFLLETQSELPKQTLNLINTIAQPEQREIALSYLKEQQITDNKEREKEAIYWKIGAHENQLMMNQMKNNNRSSQHTASLFIKKGKRKVPSSRLENDSQNRLKK